MRAIEPAEAGHLTVDGFQIAYEVFGSPAAPALLLLPTWQIVTSRHWKMQVPFLSRFRRVITFDAPGAGGSVRTTDPAAYAFDRVVAYAIGLLDQLGIERADIAGLSMGGAYGLWMAAGYPERVARAILFACSHPKANYSEAPGFHERHDSYEDWQKYNAHYWREHYDDWLDFFFHRLVSEPHSTKPIDDGVGWAHETAPEFLIASVKNVDLAPAMSEEDVLRRVRCPVLLVHGDADQIVSIEGSRRWIEARPDFALATFEGNGHAIPLREPVRTNLLMRDFLTGPLHG